jgi:large subunit ribosomal protein L4
MTSLTSNVYTQDAKPAGKVTLPESVFGLRKNTDLVHQVIVSLQSNARAGTAHTKSRAEVSGGGKKPWKQKGTGRARHGSNRSPIWIGGGITHGPRADKNYDKKINEKVRRKALFHVLSDKLKAGMILFVEDLRFPAIKTKDASSVLTSLSSLDGFTGLSGEKRKSTLVVCPELAENVRKSMRNIPKLSVRTLSKINALDVAAHQYIVFVQPKDTIAVLEKKVAQSKKKTAVEA